MMPVSSGMRFDTENSRCIPAERMTPEELRQLHRLAIERRPEACFGCGLEHECRCQCLNLIACMLQKRYFWFLL